MEGDVVQGAAITFVGICMNIVRTPDPKGDRVNVVLSGKFLPYRQYEQSVIPALSRDPSPNLAMHGT